MCSVRSMGQKRRVSDWVFQSAAPLVKCITGADMSDQARLRGLVVGAVRGPQLPLLQVSTSSASIRVRLARGSITDGSYTLLGREVSRLVGGHAMDSVDAVCDDNALASRFRVLRSRPTVTGSRICGQQGGGVC